MVVKINFQGGKNQFSSPCHPQTTLTATRAQVTLPFDWLTFAVKLGHRTSFTANASQSNESVTSARVWPPNKLVCYLCTP